MRFVDIGITRVHPPTPRSGQSGVSRSHQPYDDKNSSTVIICLIEKPFVGALMGKEGSVINRLRKKYAGRIIYNNHYGRVVISGKKGPCEDAEREVKYIIAEAEKSNGRR